MNLIGWFQILLFSLAVLAVTKPLGVYMHRVFEGAEQPLAGVLGPLERLLLRLCGVDPRREQAWGEYALSLLAFSLLGVLVTYAPGGRSPAHHHAGSVMAFVLTGAIRSENSATGPARVYHAGESFFEPPGSEHLVSENASATEPASLLAVFVADDGAELTHFDR